MFRDIQTIQPGDDFRSAILQSLQSAQVVIVVIGRWWLTGRGSSPASRLHDPADYVRIEIESALEQELAIIPVLVEGASMPAAAALPESIGPLAFRQAHEVSDSRWAYDVDRLGALVERHGVVRQRRSSVPALLSGLVAAVTRFPADFLNLLYEPRRFLATRGMGAYPDVIRAVVFLCISQLLGALLILQEWPTRSGFVDFVTSAPLLMLLVALVVSVPMYLAWRLVGAPREYQRVFIVLLYQSSFVGVALSVLVLTMLVGVKMVIPAAVDRVAQTPTVSEVLRLLSALQTAPGQEPWLVASFITILLTLATCIWLTAAWRSYGVVLDLTGVRSLFAFLLFVLLVMVPVGGLVWLSTFVARLT